MSARNESIAVLEMWLHWHKGKRSALIDQTRRLIDNLRAMTVDDGLARLVEMAGEGDVSLEWHNATGWSVSLRRDRGRRMFFYGRSALEAVCKAVTIEDRRKEAVSG